MTKKIIILYLYACLIHIHAFAKNIYVKNEAELNQANADAKPGDIIILKNGTWNNVKIKLTCSGTNLQPITCKAEKNGKVIIKGNSYLHISGSFVTVDGLYFTDGNAGDESVWEFRNGKQVANNCRITNCLIQSFNNEQRLDENYWVAFYGKNNRLDHCSFLNKTNLGVLLAVVLEDDRSRLNEHSIDSNYFGIRQPLGSNGGEIIRVGVSQHCTFYSNTTIRNNLFENCDGETEIISIKSCGNIVRNNIFKECQGSVVLRHGNNNTIEGNLFWGNGKNGTGGVRVINEGNWVVNNFFNACKGVGFRTSFTIMNGVFNSPANRYLPVKDALISNNSFVNCTPFSLGEGADKERTVAASNTFISNNIFYHDNDTSLFVAHSSIDSIYFFNNSISQNLYAQNIAGLTKEKLTTKKWDETTFPISNKKTVTANIPASMLAQEKNRLAFGFPANVGCADISFFKALFESRKKFGVRWNNTFKKIETQTNDVVTCNNASDLYKVISSNKKISSITLTGTIYEFDKSMLINRSIQITGKNKDIIFRSSTNIISLFQLSAGVKLYLNNIDVDAKQLQVDNFITADSNNNCIHYSLLINNCSFSNLAGTAFFLAQKNSYADEIIINKTKFNSNNTNLFSLKDELADKGYYNVEKITISNCVFENNNGSILNLYRGGNDESTMGPVLFFTNNKISHSKNTNELIKLYGVQQSFVQNNSFTSSNENKAVLTYIDTVKAVHEQKNNTLENSGSISENKYVNK
jgi:poly(beta-D-mannuronate) lyase